jgi:lipopolysaccharide assembly outer membrane protein LptD (OstA)
MVKGIQKKRALIAFFCIGCLQIFNSYAQSPEAEEKNLFKDTLSIDINTAQYYELLSWCSSLDLSTKGTIEDLRDRLYTFYGVSEEERGAGGTEKKGGRKITITSADKTEYFTLSEIEEDYIVLEGDVILELKDEATESRHIIRAGKIVFNQSNNYLSAKGGIEYTLIEKGEEEVFTGESLTFNVDNWKGVFFKGITSSEEEVSEEKLEFRFYGRHIIRSSKDVVTLEDGSITSSPGEPPYYQIKAKKIYVLAPGEWGIEHAVLYMGRVPVFYIPYFFKPGDEIFFHPVIGFRPEEGYFIQTTTYLVGQPSKSDESLSLLQMERGGEDYKKELKGLFLRKTRQLTEEEKKAKEFLEQTNTYAKIMLDAYMRLGYYLGFDASLTNRGVLKDLKIYTAVARSRNIYYDIGTSAFTPYRENNNDDFVSDWNNSSFLGFSFPLRYGIDSFLSLGLDWFSLNIELPLYSDPFFQRDFGRREERIDWGKIMGITGEEPGEFGKEKTQGEMTSLSWSLQTSLKPDTRMVSPYISTAEVRRIAMEMEWRTKEIKESNTPGLDPGDPNFVPESERTEYSFPERKFFYPSSYLLPGFSATLAGTILDTKSSQKSKKSKGQQNLRELPGKGLTVPWEEPRQENNNEIMPAERTYGIEKTKSLPISPKLPYRELDDPVAGPVLVDPFRHTIGYSVRPALTLESNMDSDYWHYPGDIDFSKAYSLLNTYGTVQLDYSFSILEKLFILKNTLTLQGEYKEHFDPSDSVASLWDSYLLQDYNANYIRLRDEISLTSFPLLGNSYLEKSHIAYTIAADVVEKRFDYNISPREPVYTTYPFHWQREYFSKHNLDILFNLRVWEQDQSLQTQFVLPPLYAEISPALTLRTGPLTSEVSTSFKEDIYGWEYDPLRVKETLSFLSSSYISNALYLDFNYGYLTENTSELKISFFDDMLGLKQTFSLGNSELAMEEEPGLPIHRDPTYSETQLTLAWVKTGFIARKTTPYKFSTGTGWIEEGEDYFQPESLYAGIDHTFKTGPLWKNRIFLDINLDTTWNMNLIRFSENLFRFSLGLHFYIHEFLDLNISFLSENTNTFRYFPLLSRKLGLEPVNPLTDFFKSFNIFNKEHRRESFFNAKKIQVSLLHHLYDWDLALDYTGEPILKTNNLGYREYEWESRFSIFVQWNPIPEIKRTVTYEDESLTW